MPSQNAPALFGFGQLGLRRTGLSHLGLEESVGGALRIVATGEGQDAAPEMRPDVVGADPLYSLGYLIAEIEDLAKLARS